jgi:hypothetical protein
LQFIRRGPRLIAGAWKRVAAVTKLTPSNKQSCGSKPTETESIMNLQDTLFSAVIAGFAALSFSVAAHAAPQDVVKLERVVVTGKSTQQVQQLPRVVVTGYAVREVAQLPRVTVVGYSEATLLRHATLAAAKPAIKRI